MGRAGEGRGCAHKAGTEGPGAGESHSHARAPEEDGAARLLSNQSLRGETHRGGASDAEASWNCRTPPLPPRAPYMETKGLNCKQANRRPRQNGAAGTVCGASETPTPCCLPRVPPPEMRPTGHSGEGR